MKGDEEDFPLFEVFLEDEINAKAPRRHDAEKMPFQFWAETSL